MTRNRQLWMGFAILVLFLLVAFSLGCAKRGAIRNVTKVSREQKPVVQTPASPPKDDREIRDKTRREQELRKQDLQEQRLRDQVDRGKAPKTEAADSGLVIREELEIPDIHFDFDEYKLKPEGQAILKTGAMAYIKYTKYRLVIEGHCDERGTMEYNLALGQKLPMKQQDFLLTWASRRNVSGQSVMARRGLWTLGTTRQPWPRTDGTTL